jgi:hypothetical protein
MPPQVIAIPVRNPLGQTGLQMASHYPPVAESNEPCSLFVARVALG